MGIVKQIWQQTLVMQLNKSRNIVWTHVYNCIRIHKKANSWDVFMVLLTCWKYRFTILFGIVMFIIQPGDGVSSTAYITSSLQGWNLLHSSCFHILWQWDRICLVGKRQLDYESYFNESSQILWKNETKLLRTIFVNWPSQPNDLSFDWFIKRHCKAFFWL